MSVWATPGSKPVEPDVNKAAEGAFVYDDGVAGTQTWTGATDYDSATVVNCSGCYIRGQYVFNGDVVPSGDQSFLLPPNGAYSVTFQDIEQVDDEDAITGIVFTSVTPPTVNGPQIASAAAVKTGEEWAVIVNAVES